jgi:hypothetical protein
VVFDPLGRSAKRLGRSTGRADAVATALWVNSADGRIERDADDKRFPRPRPVAVPYADAPTLA